MIKSLLGLGGGSSSASAETKANSKKKQKLDKANAVIGDAFTDGDDYGGRKGGLDG